MMVTVHARMSLVITYDAESGVFLIGLPSASERVTRKRISMTVRSTTPGSAFSLTSHGVVTHAFRTTTEYSTVTGTGTASSSVHHRSFSHHKNHKHIMSTAETHRRTRASAAASSFNAAKVGCCGMWTWILYSMDSGQNSKTANGGWWVRAMEGGSPGLRAHMLTGRLDAKGYLLISLSHHQPKPKAAITDPFRSASRCTLLPG
jgi:hypothetical protein